MAPTTKRSGKKPIAKRDLTKTIKEVVNGMAEQKYNDVVSNLGSFDASGEIVSLTIPTQGDDDRSRNGDKVMPLSLDFHYWINAEVNSTIARVIIFRWKPSTAPVVGDVLHLAPTYNVIAQYVHDQRNQFNILYDRVHPIGNNGLEVVSVNKHLKLASTKIDYSNGTINGSNKIYAIFMTDRSLAVSAIAKLSSRFNYTDM